MHNAYSSACTTCRHRHRPKDRQNHGRIPHTPDDIMPPVTIYLLHKTFISILLFNVVCIFPYFDDDDVRPSLSKMTTTVSLVRSIGRSVSTEMADEVMSLPHVGHVCSDPARAYRVARFFKALSNRLLLSHALHW